jgi:hypothetical protein
MPDPSIYDWAGGREPFARWLDAFLGVARRFLLRTTLMRRRRCRRREPRRAREVSSHAVLLERLERGPIDVTMPAP